jgi:hypothetical protein
MSGSLFGAGGKREKRFPEKLHMVQNTSVFCDDKLTAHPKYTQKSNDPTWWYA